MKKYSKLFAVLLAVAIMLPGLGQLAQAVEVADGADGTKVIRIAGKDRVETSVEASKEVFKDGQARNVVLAGYSGEVDALAGTLLASDKEAPLIFTGLNTLPQVVQDELVRLGAKNIYILGGESVVSKAVETQLTEKGYEVERLAGKNRVDTAAAIAKEVKEEAKHVFLAKGYDDYADALAAGPVSGKENMPILLTKTDKLPQETIDAMKDLGVTEVTIVGGETAISKAVVNELKDYKINRISGSNRVATAIAIADEFFVSPKIAIVANGYIFADALVGGYLGAKLDAPILLTNVNKIDSASIEYLKAHTDLAYLIGGEKVVSEEVGKEVVVVIEEAQAAEAAKDKAIKEAIREINKIGNPADLKLEDEEKVQAAEVKVETAKELGAVDADIVNLDHLKAARQKIEKLKAELSAKEVAIQESNMAIARLPVDAGDVTIEDHEDLIYDARAKYDRALELGAKKEELLNLWKLEAAEAKLLELQEVEARAIEEKITKIAQSKLDGKNGKAILETRNAYDGLSAGTKKLVKAEAKLSLETSVKKFKLFTTAQVSGIQVAIANAKTLADKEAVVDEAEANLNLAKELGMEEVEFNHYKQMIEAGRKSIQMIKDEAKDVEEKIGNLPEDKDILENGQTILNTQKAYNKLSEIQKALVSDDAKTALEEAVKKFKLFTTAQVSGIQVAIANAKTLADKEAVVDEAEANLNLAKELGMEEVEFNHYKEMIEAGRKSIQMIKDEAKDVEEKIGNLPEDKDILENGQTILNTQKAYNKLSEIQKALVSDDAKTALEEAVKKFKLFTTAQVSGIQVAMANAKTLADKEAVVDEAEANLNLAKELGMEEVEFNHYKEMIEAGRAEIARLKLEPA